MGMIPSDFFASFVLGNYADYGAATDCIRKAFNAATSAFQLADHVHAYYGRRSSEFLAKYPKKKIYLQHLESRCTNFLHVQSVATVYKHLYSEGLHYTVSSGGSIDVVEGMDSVYRIASPSEFGTVNDDAEIEVTYLINSQEADRSYVVIKTRTGERLRFLPILESVIDMWSDEIMSLHESYGY